MSTSSQIRIAEIHAVYQVIGECRELGDDPEIWRQHFFKQLAQLVSADLVIGGEMASLKSGQPRDLGTTVYGWENGFNPRGWERALELLQTDPTYSPVLAGYARRVTHSDGLALRLTEFIHEPAWRRSVDYQEVNRTIGVEYSLYCLCSIPDTSDEVNGPVLMRAAGRRNFNDRETAIVQLACSRIAPLVGGPLARFAEPAPSDLPPRVREVLRCVLEGDGDKQIAKRLGIRPLTVNVHTKVIYRHFHVQSRTELLARWIRRGWGNRFAWAE